MRNYSIRVTINICDILQRFCAVNSDGPTVTLPSVTLQQRDQSDGCIVAVDESGCVAFWRSRRRGEEGVTLQLYANEA